MAEPILKLTYTGPRTLFVTLTLCYTKQATHMHPHIQLVCISYLHWSPQTVSDSNRVLYEAGYPHAPSCTAGLYELLLCCFRYFLLS